MSLDRVIEIISIPPDARVWASAIAPMLCLALAWVTVKLSEREEQNDG